MTDMTQEEKQALLHQWKREQEGKMTYLLHPTQVRSLFDWLETALKREPCDHTLRHTMAWIERELPDESVSAVLGELREMGGWCDCEVLFNCYEDMDPEEME